MVIRMKILVTGGAGFIGTNCINYFNKKKDFIINVDKLGIGSVNRNLSLERNNFQKIDISRKFPLELLNEIDLIINFASESHVDRSIDDPMFFYKNNLGLIMNLLEAMRKSSSTIRMVHVSTDEVYGDILKGSFTEDSPLKPSSPYAASKASQDSFVLSYVRTYGLNISITRCTNNYGAFQLPEKLIPKAIIRAMMGNKVPIYGDGMQIRDWLYVDDHCRAIDLVAEKGQKGEIYNVSAGNEIPNIEIIKIILSLLNKDDSLLEHVEDRKGHDIRYSLDSKKIREMGWKPQIEIKEGLNNTVKWYQENRNWWKKLIKFL